MIKRYITALCLILCASGATNGQLNADKQNVLSDIEASSQEYFDIAQQIWGLAELGFLEEESAKLLSDPLTSAGFKVEYGVAGMPTAFVAEYGSGQPVIAFLAEYDALPGMAQAAVPYPEPLPGGGGGPGPERGARRVAAR